MAKGKKDTAPPPAPAASLAPSGPRGAGNRRVNTSAGDAPASGGVAANSASVRPPRTPRTPVAWGKVRAWVSFSAVLFGLMGVGYMGYRSVLTGKAFALREVRLEGAVHLTREDVIRLSLLHVGENLFRLDAPRVAESVRRSPWVKSALVRRVLPGTLLVEVTERTAVALWSDGTLYFVSAEGEIFKPVEPGDNVDLPIITSETSEIGKDRAVLETALEGALQVIAEYNGSALAKKWPLAEVHVLPDGAYRAHVGRSGVRLDLGRPPFGDKVERTLQAVSEVERRGQKPVAVFLSEDAERAVVRIADPAAK